MVTLVEINPKLDKVKNIKSENDKSKKDNDFSFVIDKLRVSNSEFNYIDKDPKEKRNDGDLKFNKIMVNSDNIHIKKANLEQPISLVASGYLEKNLINIDLELDSLAKDFNLKLRTSFQNADVGSMNSYLIPVENIKIYGTVISSFTESEVHNRQLKTHTKVEYVGLKLDALTDEDDQPLAMSMVIDLFANLKICNSKFKDKNASNEQTTILTQKEESVVQFLLRGLLDNYMKISCVK